jgi:hypothetical protein
MTGDRFIQTHAVRYQSQEPAQIEAGRAALEMKAVVDSEKGAEKLQSGGLNIKF